MQYRRFAPPRSSHIRSCSCSIVASLLASNSLSHLSSSTEWCFSYSEGISRIMSLQEA